MKNYALFILALFMTFTVFTPLQAQKNTTRNMLIEVNREWLSQPVSAHASVNLQPGMADDELIRTHLMLVERYLSAKDVSHLSAEQQQNRNEGLAHLRAYMEEGAFPRNTSLPYRNPVFIDEFNNYCAVGYLIKSSGHDDLAKKISAETNLAYLGDITTEGLGEWVTNSGFTPDELAWIQPGYPPTMNFYQMGGGTNGVVYDATLGQQDNLIIAGSFTDVDGAPIQNIAQWMSGFGGFTWTEVGGGINGTVKAILEHDGVIYAGGSFSKAGNTTVNNIARYENGAWHTMGSINGTVNDLIVYNNAIYAAGDFVSTSGLPYKGIAKWDGSQWTSIIPETGFNVNGEIYEMIVWENQLVWGGNFSLSGSVATNNIALFDGNMVEAMGNGAKAPVRALEVFQNTLYAAGDFINGADTFGIARFQSGSWENLLDYFGYLYNLDEQYITALERDGGRMLIGGDFHFDPLGGTYSKNLVVFDGNYFNGLGDLDAAVNTLVNNNDFVYMGGAFKKATSGWAGITVELNSISYFNADPLAGKDEHALTEKVIGIYPNPFTEQAVIELNNLEREQIKGINVYDISGKLVMNIAQINDNKATVSAGQLARGKYIVSVVGENGVLATEKLIVN